MSSGFHWGIVADPGTVPSSSVNHPTSPPSTYTSSLDLHNPQPFQPQQLSSAYHWPSLPNMPIFPSNIHRSQQAQPREPAVSGELQYPEDELWSEKFETEEYEREHPPDNDASRLCIVELGSYKDCSTKPASDAAFDMSPYDSLSSDVTRPPGQPYGATSLSYPTTMVASSVEEVTQNLRTPFDAQLSTRASITVSRADEDGNLLREDVNGVCIANAYDFIHQETDLELTRAVQDINI